MPGKSIIVQKYYKLIPLLLSGSLALPAPSLAQPSPHPAAEATHSALSSFPRPQQLGQRLPSPPPPPANRRSAPLPPPPPLNPLRSLPDSSIPNRRYALYINGDSPLLLKIVQKVEPTALLQSYQNRRVILIGYFADEASAQQRATQLKERGIQSQIASFDTPEEFSQIPPIQQPNSTPISPNFPPSQPTYLPSQPALNSGARLGRYQVYADASSNSLAQVRRIEPTAFVRQYQGRSVIQAGSFADEFNARRRLETLASRGIRAGISRSGQEVNFSVPNQSLSTPISPYVPPPTNLRPTNYYFVLISGRRRDLSNIAEKVLQLGVPPDSIFPRDVPGDPHVTIGPFTDRQIAERWQRYLSGSGLKNVRVDDRQ